MEKRVSKFSLLQKFLREQKLKVDWRELENLRLVDQVVQGDRTSRKRVQMRKRKLMERVENEIEIEEERWWK